ncbi:MAG: T9SS type A sorting domain-containing protein [Calditrichaeota bacterium]|nr:T9SS type A sorting domain-containing protein [Calditrichota bacterium]
MENTHYKIIIGVLTLALAAFFQSVHAEIINVPDDFETIQEAIEEARNRDSVLVAPGEYNENIDFLGKTIRVIGNPDSPAEVIINGGGDGPCVSITSGEEMYSRLVGFTLTNGVATGDGYGGGIIIENSSTQIIGNIIAVNSASEGGGGISVSGEESIVFIQFNLIYGNETDGVGGGVLLYQCVGGLVNNTIVENRAGQGGGGVNFAFTIGGGAINNIIASNTNQGLTGWDMHEDAVFIYNDVWDNEGGNYNNIEPGEGSISEDPLFVNPDEGDYHLTEDSPCIDVGDPRYPNDPDSSPPDIGAYYFHHYGKIEASPDSLDFGSVAVDSIAGLEFTLENTTDETWLFVTIFPVDPEHFRLSWTGERAESVQAMDVIREVYTAMLMYRQDVDEEPRTVEELIEREYLEIPDSVMRKWDFSLVGRNPITLIEAVSTDEMPDGEGHEIIYDIETGRFEGYGTPMVDPQAPLRAMEAIDSIHEAIIMFNQDFNEDPYSVAHLLAIDYLVIPWYIDRQWDFSFIGENPITGIEAVSTNEMYCGSGKVISYDIESDSFSGYRHPYQEFFDLLWGGNLEYGTLTLLVTFQPDEERRYSSEILIIISGGEDDPDTLHIPLEGNGVLSISKPPEIPEGFTLLPAYPNPFNSTTTIRYALSYPSNVSLHVYNTLGQQIRTLFEGYRKAGVHTANLTASDLPSGLYFVKLNAGGQTFTQKVMLIR